MPYPRHGTSLVELTATLAVLAIALALSSPYLSALVTEQRASTAANRLLATLQSGRMNAVMRGRTVQVCPSRDLVACTPGAEWEEGVVVRLVQRGRHEHGRVLQTLQGDDIKGLRLLSSRDRVPVTFLRDGRSAGTNQTLSLCNSHGRLMREIIVSNTGRSRVRSPPAGLTCPAGRPR